MRKRINGLMEENLFGFSKIAGTITQVIGHEKKGDFGKARQELMSRYTIDDLLKF